MPSPKRARRLALAVASMVLLCPAIAAAQARPAASGPCARLAPRACYTRALALTVDSVAAARQRGAGEAGIRRMRQSAAAQLERTCEDRLAEGCFVLGRVVEGGLGVTKNPVRAAQLYRLACVLESGPGCNALGEAFAFGIGVTENTDSAISAFRQGCGFHHATACARVGRYLEDKKELGRSARDSALSYAGLACRMHSDIGCLNFALYTMTQLDSVPPAKRDARFAARRDSVLALYTRLCDAGQMTACNNLGVVLQHGEAGTRVRSDSARRLYAVACSGRFASTPGAARAAAARQFASEGYACSNLAWMALKPSSGRADTTAAVRYFRLGCDALMMSACHNFAYYGGFPVGHPRAARAERALRWAMACLDRQYSDRPQACMGMGNLLSDESNNAPLAITWWARSCFAGNAAECDTLSRHNGVAPLQQEAFKRKACELAPRQYCGRTEG